VERQGDRRPATGDRKEATEWHNIVVFNQNLVKIVEQYVKKGSRVAVEGKIKTRKWQSKEGTDRYSTEIVIDRFDGKIHLEGKPGGGGGPSEDSYGTTKPRSGGGSSQSGELDDEIPFQGSATDILRRAEMRGVFLSPLLAVNGNMRSCRKYHISN
jgi:single-strand DNA-binding protein